MASQSGAELGAHSVVTIGGDTVESKTLHAKAATFFTCGAKSPCTQGVYMAPLAHVLWCEVPLMTRVRGLEWI